MDLLFANGWAVWLLATWLGLCVGSFLNVVIYRLPVMLERGWRHQAREVLELPAEPDGDRFNLIVPRSRCPSCGAGIKAWHNVPLFGWLALRGRCAECSTRLSRRATRSSRC